MGVNGRLRRRRLTASISEARESAESARLNSARADRHRPRARRSCSSSSRMRASATARSSPRARASASSGTSSKRPSPSTRRRPTGSPSTGHTVQLRPSVRQGVRSAPICRSTRSSRTRSQARTRWPSGASGARTGARERGTYAKRGGACLPAPQTHIFDRQRYVDILATFSDHATLPAEQRTRLFDAIGEIIDHQFGGHVERHSMARLQLARRRQ
jgi:hypothetical protein